MKPMSLFLWGLYCLLIFGCAGNTQLRQPQSSDDFIRNLKMVDKEPTALELDSSATLSEILALAALNNPSLKAAYYHWLTAAYQIPQATALSDPQLSYAYFIESVETRVGPQRQKFSLRQSFPWFGTLRLRGLMASKTADAKAAAFEAKRLDLFHRVKSNWYEYALLQRGIEIHREHLQLLDLLEKVMLVHYKTGETDQISLLRIQMERERMRSELADHIDQLKPLRITLNALLNQAPDAYLPNPDTLPIPFLQFSDSLLGHLVKTNNPARQTIRDHYQREIAGTSLARKGFYPGFTLGLDYIDTERSVFPGVQESGKNPLLATISLKLPIWFNKQKAALGAAKARERAAGYQLQSLKNEQHVQLSNLVNNFRSSQRKIALYHHNLIPKARQAMEIARAGFTSGKLDFKTLMESQKTLLNYALALEKHKAKGLQQLAALEQLCGQDLSAEVNND